MLAVDTNVLVRLLARDDPKQAQAADEFVAKGAWVSHLVLAETLWMLDAVYERSAPQLMAALNDRGSAFVPRRRDARIWSSCALWVVTVGLNV